MRKNLSNIDIQWSGRFQLICSMIDHFGDEIININMGQIIRYIKNPKLILYQKKIFKYRMAESLSNKKFLT